jgi:hypothetical protein
MKNSSVIMRNNLYDVCKVLHLILYKKNIKLNYDKYYHLIRTAIFIHNLKLEEIESIIYDLSETFLPSMITIDFLKKMILDNHQYHFN